MNPQSFAVKSARIGLAGLAVLAAAGVAQTAPAPDAAHGQAIFREQCGLCHTGGPGDGDGGQGPDLVGVVGRKAAAAPDFPYTAALKASGLTWTPAALDHFLTDPTAAVPGTAMGVALPDPKDRADLVAYLASLRAR